MKSKDFEMEVTSKDPWMFPSKKEFLKDIWKKMKWKIQPKDFSTNRPQNWPISDPRKSSKNKGLISYLKSKTN
jgi:hypothetical protein